MVRVTSNEHVSRAALFVLCVCSAAAAAAFVYDDFVCALTLRLVCGSYGKQHRLFHRVVLWGMSCRTYLSNFWVPCNITSYIMVSSGAGDYLHDIHTYTRLPFGRYVHLCTGVSQEDIN